VRRESAPSSLPSRPDVPDGAQSAAEASTSRSAGAPKEVAIVSGSLPRRSELVVAHAEVEARCAASEPSDLAHATSSEAAAIAAEWQVYDFRRATRRLSPLQLHRLERMMEDATALLVDGLGELVGDEVAIDGKRVELLAWSDALERLPSETSLQVVRCDALRSRCFLSVSPALALLAVERLLGARSPRMTSAPLANRPLTPLEERMARPVYERIVRAYDVAFGESAAIGLELSPLDSESTGRGSRERRSREQRTEAASSLSCQVHVQDLHGRIELLIPDGPLFSYIAGPEAPSDAPAAAELSVPTVRDHLDPLTVELVIELSTAPLSLAALLDLRIGDIIDTGLGVDAPIAVVVGGQRALEARLARVDDHVVVRLV
jgi:flagellar motor switch protein FliM